MACIPQTASIRAASNLQRLASHQDKELNQEIVSLLSNFTGIKFWNFEFEAWSLTPHLAKNMKDLFLKKLQICMKTYDYTDETKDVKGKVNSIVNFLEREN